MEKFYNRAKKFLPFAQLPKRLRLADQPVKKQLSRRRYSLGINFRRRLRVIVNVVKKMGEFKNSSGGSLIQVDGLL